jgi:hypothetical protein
MRVLHLGEGTIWVFHDDHYLATEYPGGTTARATPHDTDEYRDTTRDLGYGEDTWRQCLEHELLHTWVALKLGKQHSVVLWGVAHGNRRPIGGRREEGYVMGLQRYLNTCETDPSVDEFFTECKRLWDQEQTSVVEQARELLGRE